MTIFELLEKHEGRKKKVYKCPAGKNTIGVGWNIDANKLPVPIQKYLDEYGEITEEMIDSLLEISVRHAVADCHVLFPEFDKFTDNRRMALTDFVFQLGFKRVRQFVNTIAAINTGRWGDAANGIRASKYWKQLGGDAPGTDDGKIERPETIADMIEEG